MVVLGILAATDSLRRAFNGTGPASGLDPKTFYIIPITDMAIFATLIFFAFRARSNPPAHKRLILVATTGLTIAAVARWPVGFIQHNPIWVAVLCTYAFFGVAGCIRFVDHAKSSSCDDLGQRVLGHCAAGTCASWPDQLVARFRDLGAEPGADNSRLKPVAQTSVCALRHEGPT
jgi:hypothetical protein